MSTKLKRVLTLPQLVFYGISSMVGAGIYTVIGAAAGEAGTHLWVSFLLAAIAAFIAVLSYAELSGLFPKAGAEYQYLKEAFPAQKPLAFMGGYLIALNAATTAATVSIAFGGYLNSFVTIPIMAAAFCLLLLCTIINIAGIRESVFVSVVMALMEVGGLLLLIWIGFDSGAMGKSFEILPTFDHAPEILGASALIFFVYIGFEDIADLSEETRNAPRTVPAALLICLISTSVIYILVALAVNAISTPEQLSGSLAPLTTAVARVAPGAAPLLNIAALFATASTALISLVSLSRVLFSMARAGDMPAILAKLLPKQRTPYVAALALFVASCLFLPLGEVKVLASVSSLGVLLVFVGVQAAVIRLRYTTPDASRPFRIPLSIGRLPLMPMLGIVVCLVLASRYEVVVYGITAVAILLGVLAYMVKSRWS